jgi:hypothetical protein
MNEELKNLAVVREIDHEVELFLQKVGITEVKTIDDVTKAETIRKEIKLHLKAIDEKLDPLRAAAYTAYQGWVNLMKVQKGKLEALDAALIRNVKRWKAEEDRKAEEIRAREQARIDKENREREAKVKAETERLEREQLERAAELEAAGNKKEAEVFLNMSAHAKEQAEQEVAPVAAPSIVEMPKAKLDGRTFGDKWHAEVVDMYLLCRAVGDRKVAVGLVEPNWSELNRLAKLLKDELDVPGVKAIKE